MRVVNKYKEKYTIYIGRGSLFGNPFKIGVDGNREEVIRKYEEWARHHIQSGVGFHTPNRLLETIYFLPKNAILGCYCKPKACHGDVIIKIWKELHE